MNELLERINNELRIIRIKNEGDVDYCCRLIYSELGLRCLTYSMNNKISETSKTGLTGYINKSLDGFIMLFPEIGDYFRDDATSIGKYIRIIYEETGYLISSKERDSLAEYNRTIKVGDSYLLFGITNIFRMEGLGIYINEKSNFESTIDKITYSNYTDVNDYILNNYENDIFEDVAFDYRSVKYYNPKSKFSNSQSWESKMITDYSICVFDDSGIYYKVKRKDDKLKICRLNDDSEKDSLFAREYRRLYFGLKYFYKTPSVFTLKKLDQNYYELTLSSKLPNKEQYILLLLAWPIKNVFRTNKYIISKSNKYFIEILLKRIGIKTVEVSK